MASLTVPGAAALDPDHATGSAHRDEPQLKYEQLGQDVLTVIASDRVSCLCLSEKILALGTEKGRVHVCDYSGNEVRRFTQHKGRITDLSFDREEEFLASCSEDSSVSVLNLYTEEKARYEYRIPAKTIALDPRYSARKTREFVTGGANGAVMLSSQGWLGRSDTVLHACDGPVEVVRWSGSLVAWGSRSTVVVYDTTSHQRVRNIVRTPHGVFAGHDRCSLLFGHDSHLYVSWPDCIKVGRIHRSENNIGVATHQVELVATLSTNYFVMGVAPFDLHLAVLTYSAPSHTTEEGQRAQPPLVTLPGQPAAALAAAHDPAAPTSMTTPAQQGGNPAVPPLPAAADAAAGAASRPQAGPLGTGRPPRSGVPPATVPPSSTPAHALVLAGGQPELRIITMDNRQLAADALPVAHADTYGPHSYWLVPSLPEAATAAAVPAGLAAVAAAAAAGSSSLPKVASTASLASQTAAGSLPGGTAAVRPSGGRASGASTPGRGGGGAVRGDGGGRSTAASAASSPRSSAGGGGLAAASGHGDGTPTAAQYVAGQEFLYYIVTPQDVLVGRSRDAADRVTWLLERQQYEAALHIAENDRSVPRAVYEEVVQGYIEHLLEHEAYDVAAQLSPRLLKGSVPLWERWVYLFAQWRQLPKLARYVPYEPSRLSSTAYEMVLNSLLASPAHHDLLLELAQLWPNTLYSMPALVDSVAVRMKRPGGDTPALWQLLAWLYQQQGRPDLALSIWLQLGSPTVFDFIRQHGLFTSLAGRAAQLLSIDERAAVSLLAQHADIVHPSSVVPNIQDAMAEAAQHGGPGAAELWRLRLHHYLDALFDADPMVGSEYHELQVQLYADYAPHRLMDFLVASQYYPLEAALVICESRGLVPEQVFILGRMGNATQALHLIIEKLGDIPQAIEFVRSQRDDELWDNLISWALGSPETTGSLLDHIGGTISPLHLIQRIPKGMAIPGLRDRLRSIIADFRTQTSLREGCNVILRSDCMHLLQRLYRDVRHGLPVVLVHRPDAAGNRPGQWLRCEVLSGHMEPIPAADVPHAALQQPTAQPNAGAAAPAPSYGASVYAASTAHCSAVTGRAGTAGLAGAAGMSVSRGGGATAVAAPAALAAAAASTAAGPCTWIGYPGGAGGLGRGARLGEEALVLEPAVPRGSHAAGWGPGSGPQGAGGSGSRARAAQVASTLPSLLRLVA